MRTLFRGTPAHGVEPILTGFLFCFGGVVAVVSSLQLIYERIFGQEPRGWRNLPRGMAWVAVLLALLVFDGVINGPVRHDGGPAGSGWSRRPSSSGGRCTFCSRGACGGAASSGRPWSRVFCGLRSGSSRRCTSRRSSFPTATPTARSAWSSASSRRDHRAGRGVAGARGASSASTNKALSAGCCVQWRRRTADRPAVRRGPRRLRLPRATRHAEVQHGRRPARCSLRLKAAVSAPTVRSCRARGFPAATPG